MNNIYFMQRALSLALKARGRTFPNPLVGALVVKDGRIVGKGYHKKAGLPHAEVEALADAGEKAKGAVLYVTLEPCTHYGRTAPCVDKILESGVKKVVVGMVDPNPLNNGRGIKLLEEHGVKVGSGLLEAESRKINQPFIKYITRKMPFVTVKVGQSLDGKIAARGGDSKWITSDKSREFAQHLRGEYDGIMVGVNTVIRDNPLLLSADPKKELARIIVDSRMTTPVDSRVFQDPRKPVIIATLKEAAGQETENRNLLSQKARILEIKENRGEVNLYDLLKKLARLEITNILVEGGGALIGSLFDSNLVDRVLFFIAPKIIGGKEAISSVMGRGVSRADKAVKLRDVTMKRIDDDFLIEGIIHSY
ncbi:bifunctional diaminohydroxyphosphoribosylaminopyrimidine deaminase/5-amino-6-(5-phosphoribosylamino)uracil reductase RibD [bacterium]|nr:MAG: bifunctional diaminohydroxyphosphoribosylaminopyrimidine deaminase/5-amino-6-(5-phosphoribosylamino)uracil reductase RibD [bacterium]